MAIKRFAIWERLRNDEIDSDEFSVEMFRWWKERHGHKSLTQVSKRGKYHEPSSPDLKWCTSCQQEKSRELDFTIDRSRGDGLNNKCRECQAKKWKELNCRTCDKCGSVCVGHTCKRCYHLEKVIRDGEAVIWQIPILVSIERKRILAMLDNNTRQAYLQAERLRDLALNLPSPHHHATVLWIGPLRLNSYEENVECGSTRIAGGGVKVGYGN